MIKMDSETAKAPPAHCQYRSSVCVVLANATMVFWTVTPITAERTWPPIKFLHIKRIVKLTHRAIGMIRIAKMTATNLGCAKGDSIAPYMSTAVAPNDATRAGVEAANRAGA